MSLSLVPLPTNTCLRTWVRLRSETTTTSSLRSCGRCSERSTEEVHLCLCLRKSQLKSYKKQVPKISIFSSTIKSKISPHSSVSLTEFPASKMTSFSVISMLAYKCFSAWTHSEISWLTESTKNASESSDKPKTCRCVLLFPKYSKMYGSQWVKNTRRPRIFNLY